MEEWRDIRGYEGLYQISNLGRVKSLRDNHGKYREKILNPSNRKGYLIVSLCRKGRKREFKVHRLVALHFIDNPNNYSQVNHKDENKENNRVDNLEWCTPKYNSNYGTRTQRASEKITGSKNPMYGKTYSKNPASRKVQCITTGKKFNCIKEASEYYSINRVNISKCCKGKCGFCGTHPVTGEKLKWKYID